MLQKQVVGHEIQSVWKIGSRKWSTSIRFVQFSYPTNSIKNRN